MLKNILKYNILRWMVFDFSMWIDEGGIDGGHIEDDGLTGDGDDGTGDNTGSNAVNDKYKGVDLEKWNQLKDLDVDAVKSSSELAKIVEANPELKSLIEKIKSVPSSKEGEEPSVDDKIKALADKIEGITKEKETAEIEANRTKFFDSTEKAIAEALKTDNLSLIDDENGFSEKKFIIEHVKQRFIESDRKAEEAGQEKGELDWADIPKVVGEAVERVKAYRRSLGSQLVKTGQAPNTSDGQTTGSDKGSNRLSDNERVQKVADELRALNESKSVNVI